jgi:PAS domain S-box-containing protein
VPAFGVNGQRRPWSVLAIGLGCIAALSAAASTIFGQIDADWLRFSLVAQVIVVAGLATVLARQIAALRRTQGSLVTANTDLAGAQASLETNNRVLRATQAELKRARQQLIDGLEGSTDGFALYDAEDRLVVCNSRYRELFGLHPDLLRTGMPFVDILRAHVSAGRVAAAIGREDEWIAERLAQHRDSKGLFERNIDGHWFRFSDRPTSEGGTITIFTQIDELKQREQRLRENQSILQSILDHIPVNVSITDRERRIVLLNRRLEDLYGVHQAEVVGRRVDEVRPRRYASDSAARDHVRVIETGEPVLGREDDYAEGRDAESWITNVVPIKGEDGSVRYVLRTTFEVPQLAKANRELADYRAFLIEAERQAKIASWQRTMEGDCRTIWSDNLEAVIGYTATRIYDDASFLAVVHPDDRERVARLFRAVDDAAQSYDAEYRVVRADGRTVWVRGITKVELDRAGEVVRYIGSIQDITASKHAEQALRDSEALLKEAQRRARLAYWLWDPEARRYLLAAEAGEILGLPGADLSTNEHFLPYVHEDDRPWVAEAFLGQTERLEPCVLEYRWRRPDGEVIWLRDMCEQERDSTGRVRRLVGTIQDVTAQKRSEKALRENQALLLAAQRRARIAYWLEDNGPGQAYVASDFMAEVLGVPADAVPVTDADHVKLVHPEDRPKVAHAYERAVAGKAAYAIEYRVFRGDGSIGWLRELAEFQPGLDGKGHRLIGTIQDITEQKAAETALRDSEARMRAFMDHAPVAMFVKDLDGRFTMLNRHDAVFLGQPSEDAIGRRTADFLPSDDAAIVEAHDRDVLAAGEPVERELHFSSGSLIEWSYEVKFPVRDAGGTVVAIGGVALDITAQKRMEQALRHSEELLREVVFVSHIGIFDHDHLKDTITWSAEQRKNYGFGPDEAVTLPKFIECVHPEDREWIFAAVGRAHDRAGDGRFDVEHRIIRRDGAIRWLDTRSQTFFAGEGDARRPVRTIGAVIDITDRKNAELALKESEARLRRAQLQAKLVCWSWDLEASSYFWASGSGVALGFPDADLPVDLAGYSAIVHPEDRDGLRRLYAEVEAGRDAYKFEYRVLQPEGETIWVEEIGAVGRDAGGRRVSVSGTLQDVTERKRADAALRDSEARLRAFMDHAPVAMFVKDLDGRFIMLNRHDAGFFGLQPQDVIGRRSADFLTSDDAAIVEAHDRSVLAAGAPVERELHFAHRPRIEWSYEVKFPIRDAGGAAVAIGGVAVDISALKRAEQALRDSEARLRGFLDNAPFSIYLRDTQHRYLIVNRELERFTGKTASEICGKTPEDIYPPEQARQYIANDRAVMELGAPITVEGSYPASAGYAESVTVRFPVRESSGRIVAIGGITQDVTERKQAERALRASEARMRSFMDNAPVAVAIKDLDRRFVLLNNKIELAFGRSASEIIGRRTIELSASEGAAAVDALEQQVIATGKVATAEVFFPERTALPWTFEVKFPIRDAAGAMVAVGSVAVDISDRKKAELALAESEARFRSFMDNAPFDMVVKDLQGRYLMINRGVEATWQRAGAEILGRSLPELSHSEGVAQVAEIEREVVETGHVVAREVHFTDLGPEWTYEVKFPIRDIAGHIVALGGVAIDIGDRKKAQMALAESEARLRRAQQQARLAYWSWQFAAERTAEEFRWSPGSGELLGMADAEMPRYHAESMHITYPDDRDRLKRLYDEVRAGLDNYAIEYRVRRRDGGVVWVREVAEVVRDADGRRVGVEGTMQDITDQRALEEQLRQAQKMESIGQLTGGIAHDFNNLMAVILGNLELLAEDLPGNVAAQQKIDTAIRSTLRGSDLTQRLLAFARQQSLAPKPTNIDDLIRAMRDLLLRPLGPSIAATFALAGDLWLTEIDQARLETSLLNLVINARDAMPDGGKLTIATSNVAIEPGDASQIEGLAPGNYVRIDVGDNGAGMTEEVRARAFDPFFTTKGIGKGTGLGLSMVYGFVKQSGGHVELASELGRGTTVTIYLPVAKSPGAAVVAAPADGARARETILIVKDDPAVLATLGECLKGLGYDVIAAVDGPSALATIAQHDDIALLLTGGALAGPLDSAAVARQAAAMRPRLRVIYLSDLAPVAIRPEGQPDETWRRIGKPFRKVDLARIVREVLDDRGGP